MLADVQTGLPGLTLPHTSGLWPIRRIPHIFVRVEARQSNLGSGWT
jgi:hypothetical protein